MRGEARAEGWYETHETHGDYERLSEGNKTATPLRLYLSGLSWENSILEYQSSVDL